MIPETEKPNCPDCLKAGGAYDMQCRGCVGRWLRFLRGLKAGEAQFQAWCKAEAKKAGREAVAGFLAEQGVPGYGR